MIVVGHINGGFQWYHAFPLNTTLPSELKVNFPLPSLPRVVFSSSLSKIVMIMDSEDLLARLISTQKHLHIAVVGE